MGKFCMNCGAALDGQGNCPRCKNLAITEGTDVIISATKNAGTYDREISKKGKKGMKIVLIALAVAAVTVGLVFLINYIVRMIHKADTQKVPEDYIVETVDAEEYYEGKAKILAVVPVKDSTDIHMEDDALNNLTERGFNQTDVTADYSIKGEYIKSTKIAGGSKTKHPEYETYYITSNGSVYTIKEINGKVFAIPFSDNAESRGNMIILSESDSITSYDSTSNSFYEIIPYESYGITVVTVERIDAQALEARETSLQ